MIDLQEPGSKILRVDLRRGTLSDRRPVLDFPDLRRLPLLGDLIGPLTPGVFAVRA